MEIAGYYDIETEHWDTFVCGVYLENQTGKVFTNTWKNEDEFWARILRTKGVVIAHNGGRFDHLACLSAFDDAGLLDSVEVSLVMSGSSISRCRIRGPGIDLTLADSYKMFPLPLSKLSGKKEVGLECTGEGECSEIIAYQRRYGEPARGCGGYCQIRRTMDDSSMQRVIDYCTSDVLALREGVEHMKEVAASLDIDLRYTVGGTTWNTAKRWAGLTKQPLTDGDYKYARRGYYGGRVSLFRRSAANGYEYDITSSYPFQCSQNLPTGECGRAHSSKEARKRYRDGMDGIYTAEVTVPVMAIPPLPVHARMRGRRDSPIRRVISKEPGRCPNWNTPNRLAVR